MKKHKQINIKYTVPVLALAISLGANTISLQARPISNSNINLQSINEAESATPEEELKNENGKFNIFKGTVTHIEDAESRKLIRIMNQENESIDFFVNDKTVIVDADDFIEFTDFRIGDIATSHYHVSENAAMNFIHPPQHTTNVIVKENIKNINSVHVDFFNSDLLSSKGDLKLNVTSENKIVNQNKEAFEGELQNRVLVVFHSATNFSLPAQASPTKIIVLDEDVLSHEEWTTNQNADHDITAEQSTPIEFFGQTNEQTDHNTETQLPVLQAEKIEAMNFTMNGKSVDSAKAYLNEHGEVFVSLRALIESSGTDIHWNGETRQITIGAATTLSIGSDAYSIGKMTPIILSAPKLKNDTTFVPLDFFTKLLHWNLSIDEDNFAFSTQAHSNNTDSIIIVLPTE